MFARAIALCVVYATTTALANGQAQAYQPLTDWVSPEIQWSQRLPSDSDDSIAIRQRPTRPQLAGVRHSDVELLEDALIRKRPQQLRGRSDLARQAIVDTPETHLRGYMAEAKFLERHPDWHYVRSPTASQHDVYRWVDGQRPPYAGQIKYHDSGNPSLYVRDMVDDHRSPRFFVPDDHVESTKTHLRDAATRATAQGNSEEAQRLWRDYARLRPLGATSTEIRSATSEVRRYAARERYATYTSLGAASAIALAPVLADLVSGQISVDQARYYAARSLSLPVAGLLADRSLTQIGQGALRGTARGNVIVGSAVSVTELAWLLREYGGTDALYEPAFYEETAGLAGSLGLALTSGYYASGPAAATGLWAPVVIGGTVLVTGTLGYYGGKELARSMFELFAPELLRTREQLMLTATKDRVIESGRQLSLVQ